MLAIKQELNRKMFGSDLAFELSDGWWY